MINKYFFLFILFSVLNSYSQYKFVLGDVPPADLAMGSYPKDPTANAVVLYEFGKAEIKKDEFDNVRLIFEHTVRIKIFNNKAFDYATVQIPLQKSFSGKDQEKLIDAKAMSVNPDRSVGRLNSKDIYQENINERFNIAKFTVPNVKEGAVIDYTYITSSPFFYNFNRWEFQGNIPKIYSEYQTTVPGNYKYNIKLTGSLDLFKNDSNIIKDCFYFRGLGSADCVVSTYAMKDIPAFKEEDYMTSKYNYLSAIDYELEVFKGFDGTVQRYTKTWENADDEIRHKEEIGRQARKESFFKDKIDQNIATVENPLEKAKKLYYALQNQLFWNGKNNIFNDVDIKRAYESKSGSVAELNLVLLNALNALGFDAKFMLISTRDQGFATKLYPVISDFNYLVVKVEIDGKPYLLDISDKNLPFGMLPFKALNSYGRVMDFKNGSYWHDFSPKNDSHKTIQAEINLEEDGKATIKLRTISTGYYTLEKRNLLKGKSEDALLDIANSGFEKSGLYTVNRYTVKNIEDPEKPIIEDYEIKSNVALGPHLILLNPYLIEPTSTNPFTLDERNYEVNFGYPFTYKYNIVVNTPSTFEIKEIPQNTALKFDNNSAVLTLVGSKNPNRATLNLRLEVNQPVFAAEDYSFLKKMFAELVTIQNNKPLLIESK